MKKETLIRHLSILALLFVSYMPIGSVTAQDTLYIEYNKETHEVIIKPKGINICFNPNGVFDVDEEVIGSIEDEKWFGKNGQDFRFKVQSFDITSSSKIEAKKFDSNFELIPNTVIPVVVEITPKPQEKNLDSAENKNVEVTNTEQTSDSNLILIISAVALAMVLILFILRIISKNKKKNQSISIEKKGAELGLEVVEVVSSDFKIGLDHVRQSKESYYLIDVERDFKDTAVHKIYLHHSAIKKMYDFFKGYLESAEKTNETGCYFIGCWESTKENPLAYNISVEDIVEPGDDIDPGEFSFSFGKKIGVKLDTLISQTSESTSRDYVQTVWMHSHPGLGLFLSSHDLLVQRQLAYSDAPARLVAFVIDTNTPNWDFAVFTAKTNGTMNNKEDLSRIYSLDELYKWSRSIHAKQDISSPEPMVMDSTKRENYYVVQINHQGNTRTLNLYFSGKTINTIDDKLYQYSGQKKIGGHFLGSFDGRGNYLFDDCDSEKQDSAMGLLIIDAISSSDEIIQTYGDEQALYCLIVCRDNDEMWIFTRDAVDKRFDIASDLFVCSMHPMKEWLRRKRVYK